MRQVTETDLLIKVIDDTIRDLQLRKAEILARQPIAAQAPRMTHLSSPDGRTRPIQERKLS